ncbi:MAG: biopolymer transporter ExbD [Deferribacteres bacterium]|nr:biopolymer transporter ExbD [candidate division KSB1 bacterium]MCB9503982.1 biopolymer transporter ExbD [Deferribacteres bacterium]
MLNLSGNKFTLGARHRGRSKGSPSLRLTSMIDMFTILLVFLLKNFSADQIMTIREDLILPNSTAQKQPAQTPVIVVTDDLILLEDKPVARTDLVANSTSNDIPNLRAGLLEKKQIADALGRQNAAFSFKGQVTIQGDKEIPFRILKKIMVTCGVVGYSDILLAVYKVE